ncbi:hypothetical protein BHU72_01360 [Desulfuribacillus stibiiarsenatis]|uniref:Capsule synthesis protein CapA domain-containing protein n=1 Tax=Desulfuribacillus stibiiarsenatis TaxID=1390249 RepID=A0A1E5L9X4_9FIRM|nr:CapA family protein [Desulfuribacillus stibiiarsenatis]OEH86936.1 hypothetical protein BHU72_01360 [Desulfuribacillus stibiiarsenatis]
MFMKAIKSLIIFACIAMTGIMLYLGNQIWNQNVQQKEQERSLVRIENNIKDQLSSNAEQPVPPKKPQPKSLTIAAVGDIMVHMEQIQGAQTTVDGQKAYDFNPALAQISPFLKKADFIMGNLETTIAGVENRGYSGYPEFNAPESLLFALKKAGFDYVSTANNHSLDRREKGVIKTIENLEKAGLLFSGTARSQEERDLHAIVERNGIKLALLSYTYGTNGIPIPTGKDYLVNLIDKEKMKSDITSVRDAVDFVIVSIHFGHEYHRKPNAQQIEISNFLVEQGVDVVLGSHPHVIQPATWIDNSFVIYSMGNFVSAQRGDYKDNGVVVYLNLHIDEDGNRAITNAKFLPTYVSKYTHQGKSNYRVLAAEKSIQDFEDKVDPLLREFDYQKLKQAYKDTTEHLQQESFPVMQISQ